MFSICYNCCIKLSKIKYNPEGISNIKPFINQHNWKEISFPSHKKDWKKFESNNESIPLNILHVPYNTEENKICYISKHNSMRKNQVILLMITDNDKWHYLVAKKLFALFKKITSKHTGDVYCLNCLHSFRTENKLKEHENVCKDHDYCYIEMPKEKNILKYKHEEKSVKIPFVIYADMEPLLYKIYTCHSNPEKSSTTKIDKHTASGYSLFTHCLVDNTKNKHDYYRGKDCMKNLCKDLKEHATKIISYKKKK